MLAHSEIIQSPDELMRLAILREKCKKSFYFFCRYIHLKTYNRKIEECEHLTKMCAHLQAVYDGEIKKLIINIPRGYGKTQFGVIYFVAWCMGLQPDSQFIHTTYSSEVCTTTSGKAREIVTSEAYQEIFPGTRVLSNSKANHAWRTSANGSMYAAGLQGSIRGFRAGRVPAADGSDVFGGAQLIDDPHKSTSEFSGCKGDTALNTYHDTLLGCNNSRNTPVILIMQRLHLDDLCGWLIKNDKTLYEWVVLSLAAIKENGEPLWPTKHTYEELKQIEANNKYYFWSQYMQDPMALGGSVFKEEYWQYYEELPDEISSKFLIADTALKKGQANDYSVFQCWGVSGYGHEKKLYLLDQVRAKYEVPDLHKAAFEFYEKHLDFSLQKFLIEDKASGIGLLQDLKRKGVFVEPLLPKQSKIERANNVITYVAHSRIYLPQHAHWLTDYILEHAQFPNGSHDDQVDCTVYAVTEAFSNIGADYSWVS